MSGSYLSIGILIPNQTSALLMVHNGPFTFWLPDNFRLSVPVPLREQVEHQGRVVTVRVIGTFLAMISYDHKSQTATMTELTVEQMKFLDDGQKRALLQVHEFFVEQIDLLKPFIDKSR